MNWDRIEGNWKRIRGNVLEQRDDLAGDGCAGRIQEAHEFRDDETEHELIDWQQRMGEINRDPSRRVRTRWS